jgi:hypothetical protein
MQKILRDQFLQQIDDTLKYKETMRKKGKHDDLSGLPAWEYERFMTMALAVIQRITGDHSVYMNQAVAVSKVTGSFADYWSAFHAVESVLEAVREAVVAGHLDTASGLIHAAVFADFLEMAQHLLDEGYKDAAAVIAGSALEVHLRQLCVNASIETAITNNNSGDIVPKKADRVNADLYGAKVYSVLDQKSVTAWLDLRNKAAHGEYDKYAGQQVGIMISGIRDFITRVPV